MKKLSFLISLISILLFVLLLGSCSEKNETLEVGPHPNGWNNAGSGQFHGTTVLESGPEQCQSCHGKDYQGGTSEISCFTCHNSYPHPSEFSNVNSLEFHGIYIGTEGNWNLQSCQACHGTAYTGANTGVSCRSSGCHVNEQGPEACNTCHGQFRGNVSDIKTWAPPKGLLEQEFAFEPAVGAHQAHLLYYSHLPGKQACQECHVVPENYGDPGHIDESDGAEVIFNGVLAVIATEGGNRMPMPVYNSGNNSCTDNYCHGNWGLLQAQSSRGFIYSDDLMEGNNATVSWLDSASAFCGSCHNLPPAGHNSADLSSCTGCHGAVVNSSGEIIDKRKHINGKVNVFGEEYPMF